jgi:leucyl aminopeptidase
MTPTVTLVSAAPPDAEVLGVPVFAGLEVPDVGVDVDLEHLRACGWEAKPGETMTLPGENGTTVVAVGVGPRDEVDAAVLRRASGALVRAASKRSSVASLLLAALPADGDKAAAAQAATQGTLLGAYEYTRFKSETNGSALAEVSLVGRGGKRAADAVDRGAAIAEAV